jgi:hypothetical protein
MYVDTLQALAGREAGKSACCGILRRWTIAKRRSSMKLRELAITRHRERMLRTCGSALLPQIAARDHA